MRYYIAKFDMSSGMPEFIRGSYFKTVEEALAYLKEEATSLTPGFELTLGRGEPGDDWSPPEEK